jgi:hypothetical protein
MSDTLDKAVADVLAKLQEVIPDEDEWNTLRYGDGTGRRFASIQGKTRKNVVLVNEFGEFRVVGVLSGGTMLWHELTKLLCGVHYQVFVMEDKWYLIGELEPVIEE